jgi:copper transport protein
MARALAGLAALMSALCIASAAWAHATLVSSEPADGSVLAQPPKMVQLHFNESIAPAVIGIIDAAGKARDVATRAVGQSVLIVLPDDLPQGTQIVSYRVVSQDGHPVAGSMVFSIGAVTGAAPPVKMGPLAVLIWLARIGVYLGLFVGVGGAFFAAWIGQGPGGSTVSRGALAVGLASAVASLGLQGLDLLNLPFGGIVTSAPWTSALATSLGPSLLIAIGVMAIAWYAWKSPGILISRVLTTLSMAGVGLSLATSGHAATASPQWLTRPSLFLHGVAVAYWIGALAPLAAMAHRRNDDLPRVLRQFSGLAVPLVGLLVLSGLVLSVTQLGSLRALIETQYGILLSIKLSLVILLLGLAALNRLVCAPAVIAGMRSRRWHPCRRRRLALHAAAARIRCSRCRAALGPYPHGCGDVPGAGFARQGRRQRFCAAVDDGRRSPAAGQRGDADPEFAGARHRADGASRGARAGRLLACAWRGAAGARPLADADRRAGHGFSEGLAAR